MHSILIRLHEQHNHLIGQMVVVTSMRADPVLDILNAPTVGQPSFVHYIKYCTKNNIIRALYNVLHGKTQHPGGKSFEKHQ